ncbi:MAG: sigma-54-dependent Fis family transcriptional regulator [Acidobacteria bacterium]|nr:MAG: sigma-54-dependent Fis family transcriptional regulator [Acidobacteriota bacterium]
MTVCGRRLLLVEDEPLLRVSMGDALRKEGWAVDAAEDGVQGLALFRRHQHEVVVTDLMMPRMDGMALMREVHQLSPDTTVVIITAYGTVERAVEAMRQGAADFITKPFSVAQLLVRLDNLCSVRALREQNRRLQEQLEQRYSFGKIIGKSKPMQEVFDLIRRVSMSEAAVLIQGESGTGKELVAAAIHFNSRRRSGPYVRVSCTSLPETLIEAELFGYEKGAFTGAVQRRVGRFEAANGGTLFLDEIGELPEGFQVKLLRALQEKQVERLGSNRPVDVDVRVVSASLRPLEQEVAEGRFRQDLLFRINTVTIELPPLRARREDIPLLAEAFLREFSEQQGKAIEGLDADVIDALYQHPWPGNVRELRNVIERAVLFARGPTITLADLPAGFGSGRAAATVPRGTHRDVTTMQEAIERAEIEAIQAALERTNGRRAEAAELLGISRKTLWEKIKNYRLMVG